MSPATAFQSSTATFAGPRTRTLVGVLLFVGLVAPACDQGQPSVAEALESKAPDVPADYKANPKPRPKDLPPPTDAEFAAWDRKDPEGEKHLYKWDKENGPRILGYWEQLHLNGWQQRLFALEPRIQEKSLYIGNILEAHEAVMNNYPKAYNMGDKDELEKVEAHWTIVEQKMKKYSKNLGLDWPERDMTDPKQAEAHRKVCEAAFTPPDRSGKAKKGKKKGPI
jgi:hypothetical protein